MKTCAECKKPITPMDPYYVRNPMGLGVGEDWYFHSACGDPLGIKASERVTIEKCAAWIESYTVGQIKMACGEMTAQELRTVRAVQGWLVSALRHIATTGFEHFEKTTKAVASAGGPLAVETKGE